MEEIKDRKGNVLYTVEADDRRSAILRLAKDGASFNGADLKCSVLRDTDLSGVDFSGAYLLGADFSGANLEYANFSGAYLSSTYFENAIANETVFKGANLSGAYLKGANFGGANFHNADLNNADLRDARLKDASFKNTNLKWANLEGADLRGTYLEGADFNDAFLKNADFRGADIDLSSWTLSCKILHAVIDDRARIQLLYHAGKPAGEVNDPDLKALLNSELYKKVANKFHRKWECGEV